MKRLLLILSLLGATLISAKIVSLDYETMQLVDQQINANYCHAIEAFTTEYHLESIDSVMTDKSMLVAFYGHLDSYSQLPILEARYNTLHDRVNRYNVITVVLGFAFVVNLFSTLTKI